LAIKIGSKEAVRPTCFLVPWFRPSAGVPCLAYCDSAPSSLQRSDGKAGNPAEFFGKQLEEAGFAKHGQETMISGITGQEMPCESAGRATCWGEERASARWTLSVGHADRLRGAMRAACTQQVQVHQNAPKIWAPSNQMYPAAASAPRRHLPGAGVLPAAAAHGWRQVSGGGRFRSRRAGLETRRTAAWDSSHCPP
jgi:hypothetical protein